VPDPDLHGKKPLQAQIDQTSQESRGLFSVRWVD